MELAGGLVEARREVIGLLAPAGTSPAIIDQIARATHRVTTDSAWQAMLIDAGIEPIVDSNPEQFRRWLAADVSLWAPVVKSLDVKID